MAFLVLMMIVVWLVMAIATKKDRQNNYWNFIEKEKRNNKSYPPPKTE